MSWFTDIAGKAENLLNAMDQSAAQALNTSEKKRNKRNHNNDNYDNISNAEDFSESFAIQSIKTLSSTSSNNGNGQSSRGHTRASSFESIGSRESSKSSKNSSDRQALDDETLFEFLNNKEGDIPEEESSLIAIKAPETSGAVQQDFEGQIRALTNEISHLNRRNIELETECKRLQKRINNWIQQLGSSDNTIKELQSRESDLMASLDAKDSQIGVLKVRLHESDQELQQKIALIDKLEELNETLKNASETNKSSANENFEGYRLQIRQLESDLTQERDELKRIQTETMAQIGRLEENQKTLVDEISILQRNLNIEKSANGELEQRLKNALKNCQDLEQDYNEFKMKANKTLQDKDELIRALKNSDSSSDSDEVRRVLQSQCDAMVLEIQELREKNETLKKTLDRVQNEDILDLKSQIASLSEQLESEQKIKYDLEIELKQFKDESRYFQEDLVQTKNSLESRIADRDLEIEKLRKQLVSKRNNGQNVEELEMRFRNLTDNLIQKQTLVEQLSSEKHSLTLQLERSEQRLREAINNQNSGEVSIGIHHSQSFSNLVNRVKPVVEDHPEDGNVTRRVRRAYGQIDAFSIRLGNFLRAYPSARAAVLAYILLMHIWVAFVLIYYEPEIHGPNYNMPDMKTPDK